MKVAPINFEVGKKIKIDFHNMTHRLFELGIIKEKNGFVKGLHRLMKKNKDEVSFDLQVGPKIFASWI